MYEIQVMKGGVWEAWTSTANKARLPILLTLAKATNPRRPVRWVTR